MSPKWLLPIGLVLALGLMGLAGAAKPIDQLQLWWDKRDGPETASANALAPLINCMNRVDRDWRLFYFGYTHGQWFRPSLFDEQTDESLKAMSNALKEFGDRDEYAGRELHGDICTQRITDRLAQLSPGSPLIDAGRQYVKALQAVTPLVDSFDFYQRMGSKNFKPPRTEDAQALAVSGADYMQASTDLHQRLMLEDIRLRPAQLARLQIRFGQDRYWHLLNYMIAARTAVDEIEQGVRRADLTPSTLAPLIEAVQSAAQNGKAYVNTHPASAADAFASHLWQTLVPPADAYLEALQTLQQHWDKHAAPQQLSDDYYLVTRRYDILLSYYNKLARSTY
ncbi:DUF3829 domain-containing protein [Pseudomonas sp. SDO528_S397]